MFVTWKLKVLRDAIKPPRNWEGRSDLIDKRSAADNHIDNQ